MALRTCATAAHHATRERPASKLECDVRHACSGPLYDPARVSLVSCQLT